MRVVREGVSGGGVVEKGGKMKIEINTLEQVPNDFLKFVQMVSAEEGLNDWRLVVWALRGEGECIEDMKMICMPVRPGYAVKRVVEEMEGWFLHEVAHATFEMGGGRTEDSLWHGKSWREELDRFLNCYIPNISQRTSLWLDGLECKKPD